MKTCLLFLALLLMLFMGSFYVIAGDKYAKIGERKPAVAGQFYPDDAAKLRSALDHFFRDARPAAVSRPLALIAPHAGYIYSGQIAADAFNQAREFSYDLIVILGANHTTPGFRGVSIYPRKGFRTPLGLAEIDEALADSLIEPGKECCFEPALHRGEHSVEVEVPFVQYAFPGVKILPAVIGEPDPDLCLNFGRALAKALKGRRALIVASSDLSHYPAHDDAVKVDHQTLEAIVKLDPVYLHEIIRAQMQRDVANLATCACGEAPILAAIAAAEELGANCGTIISYANSGQTSIGSKRRVVGYGAVALSREEHCEKNAESIEMPTGKVSGELADADKKALLTFARKTIADFLEGETLPLPRGFSPRLYQKCGVFVTLRKNGELRGCIGHMSEDKPLCEVVGAMALQAAFEDPRFEPLTRDELPEIEIEISVLTPCKVIDSAEQIAVGRDGVLLKQNGRQAVFLPQVASERHWTREELLDHLCLKAGVKPGSWGKDTQLFTFQAIIFQESDFGISR